MKELTPFSLSHFTFSSNHLSMNMKHYSRRLAQGVLLLCIGLLGSTQVSAQCGDFLTEPQPVTAPIDITVSLTGSSAPVNNALIQSVVLGGQSFSKPGACSYELAEDIGFTIGNTILPSPVYFNCSQVGTVVTRYLRVTDGLSVSSPANVRTIRFTVLDEIDPVVDAVPVLLPQSTDPGECTWQATLGLADASTSDNCTVDFNTYILTLPDASTVTLFNTLDGFAFPVGITSIEVFATDESGNESISDFYSIEVVDTESPSATCPVYPMASPLIIPADAGACSYVTDPATNPIFDLPQFFSDNCGTLTYQFSSRIDDLGAQPFVSSPLGDMTGIVLPVNPTTVHRIRYRATDTEGNPTTCVFFVRVADQEDPEFDALTVPADAMLGTDANVLPSLCFYDDYAFTAPNVTDNCSVLTYEYRVQGATTLVWTPTTVGASLLQDFNVGTNTVEFRATDAAGNSTITSFTVVVEDDENPIITPAPASQTFNVPVSGTDCSKVVTFTRPSIGTISDCTPGTVTFSEEVISGPYPNFANTLSGAPAFNPLTGGGTISVQFPVGVTVIEYCWTDNLMNQTCITYTFDIDENVDPVAVCKPGVTVIPITSLPLVVAGTAVDNGSNDNCGIDTLYTNGVFNNCSSIGTHTVELTAVDFAGNTNTCLAQISIVDNVSPDVTCPLSVVQNVGTTNPCTYAYSQAITATDNCSVDELKYSINGGSFVNFGGTLNLTLIPGFYNVTLRAEDVSNNFDVCTYTINIEDNSAPIATNCPPNITVNANIAPGCSYRRPNSAPGGCIIDANVPANQWCGTVNFSDNCDGVTPVSNTASLTQTYPLGPNTITLTKTDAAGNTGTCSFTITVVDQTPPTALCQNLTRSLSTGPVGMGNVTVTALELNNSSFDNCYLDLIYEVKKGLPASANPYTSSVNFGCGDLGMQTVTLRVTEDGGTKSSTTTCMVNVQDVTAPVISNCPNTPFVVNLASNGLATLTATAVGTSATDNCSASLVGIRRGTTGAFANDISVSCTDVPTDFIAQIQYKDASTEGTNDVATCQFMVDVKDVTPPAFSITNSNQMVTCASPFTMPMPQISAIDVCNGNVASTLTQVGTTTTVPGSCPGNYQLISTWRVNDLSNNQATAVYVVNVTDTQVPTVTLPANATINLSSNTSTCTPSASYTATFSDNCTVVSTLNANATWIAKNAAGATLASGTGVTATANFPIGINTVTFSTTDACSNPATNTMTVTVVDNVAPVFAPSYVSQYCPTPNTVVTYPNTPNTCGYTFVWNRPYAGSTITDCGWSPTVPSNVNVTETITNAGSPVTPSQPYIANAPTLFPAVVGLGVGDNLFRYVATDQAGNATTCQFTIRVTDTQAPVLSGNQTAILPTICPTTTVPDYRGLVNVTDNCPVNIVRTQRIISPVSLTWTPATTLGQIYANPLDNATFVVRIEVTDGFNPMQSRDITITLNDQQAPVPTDVVLDPLLSNCGYIIIDAPTATANDCGAGTGATIYGTPGGVPAVGEDVLSGSNPAVFTSYRVVLAGGITTCQPFIITWSYSDGNGNVSTQEQSLQLCPDVIAPYAVCKTTPINVVLNPTTGTLTTNDVDDGSYDEDDCNPFTLEISKGPGGPFLSSLQFTCAEVTPNNTGATTVVLRAKDNANSSLSSTCSVQVKVIDNIAPTIAAASVPANITLDICSLTDLSQIPTPATLTATDNCSATVAFNEVSTIGTNGAAKYNYVITRTWVATDVFGNNTSANQTITVRDNAAPVFAAPANLTFSTAPSAINCNANVTFSLSNFVSDCAPDNELSVSVTPNHFSLTDSTQSLPVGSHTYSVTASDPAGNATATAITFVVTDGTAPVANCINGISVTLNASGQAVVTPNLVNNQSTDNCTASNALNLFVQELDAPNGDTIGNPAAQILFGCGEADGDTEYPMILLVRDAAGNTSICETYVVIQDNVAPVITCPASLSVDCATILTPNVGNNGVATATDNCPMFVTITNTDAPQYNGYSCGNVVRTWRAVDQAGNAATCVQTFTITDTKPPIFLDFPLDGTFDCSNPLSIAPVFDGSDVDDDCTPSDSIKIVFVEMSTQGTSGPTKYNYTTTRTWTITDKCGNSNTKTQTVTVQDTIAPQFLGLSDTITVQSASFPPTTNCTVPVQLNPGLPSIFSECAPLAECTVNSVSFFPALLNPITPNVLDVSGNYPVGITRVIFDVTDPSGNNRKDTVYVKVIDNSTPTAICKNNIVVSLGSNGQGSITANDVNLNSTDNCGIASLVLNQTTFDCQDLGINTVVMTATDVFSNTNSCAVAVEVVAGNGTGFNISTTATAATYFGAANGSASVTATPPAVYSYSWTNSANTVVGTTATVNGLAAGTYTVVVTNPNTGCQQSTTVVVPDGPKVKFTVGNVTGTSGSIVKVPVYAEHFHELSGFSFTLNLDNAAIGSIVSPVAVSNVNPALAGLSATAAGTSLAVFWTENSGNDITLNAGASTLMFELCVQLSQAPLGTQSGVIVGGLPPDPAPLALRDGGVIALPTESMNGSIQITLGLNEYDIAGDIQIWNPSVANPGVANVTVGLAGTNPAQVFTTLANGQYNFNNVPATTNTVTTPSKITQGPAFNAGISVADHIILKQHLGAIAPLTTPFTSPYQFVAADVNFSGTINIIDLNLIQRVTADNKRLSQITPTAPKDWVFVPKTYTFAPFGSSIPFANVSAYPQTISHSPIFQDQLNDDFVAVRLGDLNGNTPLSLTNEEVDDRSIETLIFNATDRDITAGDVFEVPFTSENFTDRLGYQFTMAFDPNVLEVVDITTGDLPDYTEQNNFGTVYLDEGSLTTVWSNTTPVSRPTDAVLFKVKFKALHSSNSLSQSLTINSQVTPALSVQSESLIQTDVELVFNTASSVDPIGADQAVLYQNQPNPFAEETMIGFRLMANERATVRIFNANGQLVRTIVGDFAKGFNSIMVRPTDLGAAGVYYYELSTPTFSDRKKMILID
jgi:Cohesin domain/HYR domain